MEKSYLVGIKTNQVSIIEQFEIDGIQPKVGDPLIVRSYQDNEEAFGIVSTPRRIRLKAVQRKLNQVIRKATKIDIERQADNERQAKDAYRLTRDTIKELKLPMQVSYVEFNFTATKATVFFTSETRVDYRILVRELANHLKIKIEMKQIGVRELAKMTGGCGVCGETLCCSTFLKSFEPISIKMAKVQDLSLNPTKISGYCGRLMCCLEYEFETYREIKQEFPKQGCRFQCDRGNCAVIKNNLLQDEIYIYEEDNQRTGTMEKDEYKQFFKPGINHMLPLTQAEPYNREKAMERKKEMAEAEEKQRPQRPMMPKREKVFNSIEDMDFGDDEKTFYNPSTAASTDKKDRPPREARPSRPPRPERGPRSERGSRPEKGQRDDRPKRDGRPPRDNQKPKAVKEGVKLEGGDQKPAVAGEGTEKKPFNKRRNRNRNRNRNKNRNPQGSGDGNTSSAPKPPKDTP